MKKITILFLIIIGCWGCAMAPHRMSQQRLSPEERMFVAYSRIEVKDGVSEEEGVFLASEYFHAYLAGCGCAFTQAMDRGAEWEVGTVIGYAALPYDSIFINKVTGDISCAKGPTIEAPNRKSLEKTLSLGAIALLKNVQKLEIRVLFEEELILVIEERNKIDAFLQALSQCLEMEQIDTPGTHQIKIILEDGSYIILHAAIYENSWCFIRIPEIEGVDKYFEGNTRLRKILQSFGVREE